MLKAGRSACMSRPTIDAILIVKQTVGLQSTRVGIEGMSMMFITIMNRCAGMRLLVTWWLDAPRLDHHTLACRPTLLVRLKKMHQNQ